MSHAPYLWEMQHDSQLYVEKVIDHDNGKFENQQTHGLVKVWSMQLYHAWDDSGGHHGRIIILLGD